MDIFSVISLFGGLALFLYGMSLLGSGLERASGGRLERTLEKLTNNVFMGVLLGAVVTAAIQSSSATTVIVVGLVNARVLKLRGAIGVIMGANIGTTITAHILRLSDMQADSFFLRMLKPTSLAPLACIIGILLYMASSRGKKHDVGQILLGFGILFSGMFAMEGAVKPLAQSPHFSAAFAAFGNMPLLGVLVGAAVTALIQSSSASVGILQALTATGQITFGMAFPIIMGQNIGTTITPVLASIGASKNAKRAACVHASFNIIGTVIFLVGCYAIQYTIQFPFWNSPIDKGGIANFHTVFNVAVTLMFIPFVGLLEKLACTIFKDKGESEQEPQAVMLDERLMVSPGLAVEHVRNAVLQMAGFSETNYKLAFSLLENFDPKVAERVGENEDVVDKLQDRVETYLLKLSGRQLTEAESRSITEMLHICEGFERMADHAQNIAESAEKLHASKNAFSKRAMDELNILSEAVAEIMGIAQQSFRTHNMTLATSVEPLEQVIDEIEQALRSRHIDRLRKGKCTVDAAFPFVEILTDLERISDHCSNVALSVLTYGASGAEFDKHEYVRQLRERSPEIFNDKYVVYTTKYYNRLRKENERIEKPDKSPKKK